MLNACFKVYCFEGELELIKESKGFEELKDSLRDLTSIEINFNKNLLLMDLQSMSLLRPDQAKPIMRKDITLSQNQKLILDKIFKEIQS